MRKLFAFIVFGLALVGGTVIFNSQTFAATYTYTTSRTYASAFILMGSDISILGHNTTKGVEVNLPYSITTNASSQYVVNYSVPDDGCTWSIMGSVNLYGADFSRYVYATGFSVWTGSFTNTVTTTGTYSGPALDSVSASISTADKNAIISGVTGSSTISSISTNASTAATQATTAATQATTAATKATSAASNTTYSGQSAAYWAYQANSSAASAANTTPPVYTVVQGVAFTKIMYGELTSGTSNGVTAASTSGSGYTTLTGTLNTVGPVKAIFGGTMVLFNVIAPPTTSPATVSFSN